MSKQMIPGTSLPLTKGVDSFALFRQMIEVTGGLSLSQVCSITGLEGSTIQNWVKRGWVANPVQKKYGEEQLARILIMGALRDSLQLEQIADLLRYVNGSAKHHSDHIIQEALLFDFLCQLVNRISLEDGISRERVHTVVKEIMQAYQEPYPKAGKRLQNALTVMGFAYAASLVRQEAELALRALQ